MSFAKRVIDYHDTLDAGWELPPGIEILFPYDGEETMRSLTAFYKKYYDDDRPRAGIFGINPGRFGAGVTGVPFTDPIRLEEEVGISNNFKKRQELSSVFVYQVINAWGGPEEFYKTFYISSVSPLGFTKNGRNYNYYDDKKIKEAVRPHIIEHLEAQLELGVTEKVAVCMGRGKNSTFLEKLNEEEELFDDILTLPHPRWVMQYRRVRVEAYVGKYLEKLRRAAEKL